MQGTVFGSGHGERLVFSTEAARCVAHVRQQAVLILIEALDLENLLLMVHDETPFRLPLHHIKHILYFLFFQGTWESLVDAFKS